MAATLDFAFIKFLRVVGSVVAGTAEATAAYLFGLSVGLAVRSLPERIDG
jgi:hypothetical protein